MNQGKTVFSQLKSLLPYYEFNKCVARYNGDYRIKEFTCKEHLLVMSFAKLTYRDSSRDIESCLQAMSKKLYHSGTKKPVARNTLAKANERSNWRIYADFAQVLIAEACKLYAHENTFLNDNNHMAYALDSTTIDLCLLMCPWAKFRQNKGTIKMHTLLDLQRSIPTLIKITPGSVHDVNILDHMPIEAGAFYIMDMGCIDYYRLYRIQLSGGFFVIRAKENMAFDRVYRHSVLKELGIQVDQTIKFTHQQSQLKYPAYLRRIKFYDREKDKTFIFLTNHFEIAATTIACL